MARPPHPPLEDHYAILAVPSYATYYEIRLSYRQLAMLHHPDKHSGLGLASATEKMRALNAAWEVLQDGAKRKEYDVEWQKMFGAGKREKAGKEQEEARKKEQDNARKKKEQEKAEKRAAAEEEAKREESRVMREEFLPWERTQKKRIHQAQKQVQELGDEIAALKAAINDAQAQLASEPYWWNILAWTRRLSEEKEALRRDIQDYKTQVIIKETLWGNEKSLLKHLSTELGRRRKEEKKQEAEQHRKHSGCTHNAGWEVVEDKHDCLLCAKNFKNFYYCCPKCGVCACKSCMRLLKS